MVALSSKSLEELEGEAAHKEKLIYSAEIERNFSREGGAQGLLIPGRAPIACARLTHAEIETLRTLRTTKPAVRIEYRRLDSH